MVPLDDDRSKSCVPASVLPNEADLQLLFARLNYEYFNGEVPDCRIRYNERFSNSAGRITYHRVLGAILFYLMIAVIFASLFMFLGTLVPKAFAGMQV